MGKAHGLPVDAIPEFSGIIGAQEDNPLGVGEIEMGDFLSLFPAGEECGGGFEEFVALPGQKLFNDLLVTSQSQELPLHGGVFMDEKLEEVVGLVPEVVAEIFFFFGMHPMQGKEKNGYQQAKGQQKRGDDRSLYMPQGLVSRMVHDVTVNVCEKSNTMGVEQPFRQCLPNDTDTNSAHAIKIQNLWLLLNRDYVWDGVFSPEIHPRSLVWSDGCFGWDRVVVGAIVAYL